METKLRRKALIRLFGIGLTTYLTICFVLFLIQRSLLYFPPRDEDGLAASDERLEVDGAILRISVRERPGPVALIYFGGNAEDVSYALREFDQAFPNHSLYMMHYRGYCGSTGKPAESSLHADAEKLLSMVRAKHSQVTLVGRSLGSGIAVRLASRNPVECLILITPYDSILNIAAKSFPIVPVRLLMLDRYESWRYAPDVRAPTLMLVAENDQVIPKKNSLALFEAFKPGVAKMEFIEGVDHNSISSSQQFWEMLSVNH